MIRFRMLTTDVESRCSVGQLRLCHWMRGPTSTLTPYRKIVYTEENCLPQLFSPPPPHAVEGSLCQHSPSESTRSPQRPTFHAKTETSFSTDDGRTACTGTATDPQPSREVHRRKKSAVERLEHRLRVLNDPTNTAVLHSVTPSSHRPAAAMKAKISSAGKKVFQTFVHHSSRSFSSSDV